ncbi:Titin [Larimichthys crocea]|uniref:Uncharacterized protein n=1 Tax=Larimichthys crocea TaxID=215358 RepID=A0ACD3QGT0_LARCR|nr:Titin [Larimichthys crocea]
MEASNSSHAARIAEDEAHTLNINMTQDTNAAPSAKDSQSPRRVIVQGQPATSVQNGEHSPNVQPDAATDMENAIKPQLQIPTFSTFTVKNGEELRVEIPVVGQPTPKIEWQRDGHAVKETSRLEVSNTPLLTVLHIRHGVREHSGHYSIIASNPAGKCTGEITVVVLEKPDPPKGPVRIDEVNSDYVTISWEPPEYTGGCELDNYIVEKREISSTEWQTVSATTVRTTIKVTKLKTGNEYQFRVFAENSTAWWLNGSLPAKDGGSPIIGYHLERKEKNSILWTKLNKFVIPEARFKTSGLEEGIEYEFRVFAENIAGLSSSSKISDCYVARDPCDPPGKPEAVVITRENITLQWEKPKYDGGSTITGYIVEKKELPDGRWMKANFTSVTENQFTVTGLIGESVTIIAQDVIEGPTVSIDPKFKSTTIVPAGETFVIDADYSGKPLPEVTWLKDGKEIDKVTPRMEVKNTLTHTTLTVRDCIRVDGGHFVLSLSNTGGTTSVAVNVKVLDRPGPPDGPLRVKVVSAEKCNLHWNPPVNDGGASVTHFIVEKRETSRVTWTGVDPQVEAVSYKVTKLVPGKEYIFRVAAVNKYGVGEFVESDPFTAQNPFTTPSAPSTPTATTVTGDSIVLTWERPETDGGSEIDGYILEKRDKEGVRWTKCNRRRLNDLRFRCTGLAEGHYYQFRVLAENAAGVGAPSEPSEYIKVTDYSSSSVSLSWSKPIYDGGATISGYVVEMKEAADDEWITCSPSTGKPEPEVKWSKEGGTLSERAQIEVTNSYTVLLIENVNRNDTGKYVLTAENYSGSKSAFISVRVLDTPTAPTNLEIKEVKRDSVSISWEAPLIDGGAKISHYVVEKREETRKAFTSVCSNCVRNSCKIDNLQEGCFYYFRVLAVNEFGTGLPAEIIDAVKVCEAPLPPGKITVSDVTSSSGRLSWEKPDQDGGSKISCYIVEMQVKGDDTWTICSESKALEVTINGLANGKEYFFRVSAVNEKGKSEPTCLLTPVTVNNSSAGPIMNLLSNTFSVKAGNDLKIDVPYKGVPQPTATWTKDGNLLKETSRVNTHTSDTSSQIIIKDASRIDAGVYEVTLANSVGTTSAEIFVNVFERPGPPTDLSVDEVSADFMSLSWQPPHYTGGCQISNYVVEKRDTGSTIWQTVSATVARTSIKISRLTQGTEYQFRIAAENRYGKSHFVESEPVVAQYPFKPPGPPINLRVVNASKSVMVVVWSKPDNDGGSPIIGYHIECKDQSSILWTKLNKGPVTEKPIQGDKC